MTASGPAAALRPIAVFDSGVGGLTVLHELLVSLPHEDFVYLGDTARFPYGDRAPEELRRFAVEVADVLLAEEAKLLVVACNAATAAALSTVEEHLARTGRDIGVVGVVTPESQQAVEATHNGRIGLLATPVTVASGAYARAVAAADPNVDLVSVPCPDLAPIIQNGFPFDEQVVETVRAYVAPLREAGVDTVILGCTHYPLVRPMLQRMLGRDVALVTSGAAIARRVEHALAGAGMESPREGEGDYRFMCTADVESFRTLGTRFLQMPLGDVAHVELPAGVAS
ncbi:MAG: glutamate racemase [Actinomycetota bacterium]|nr:glutamate racemase [Actinomycetota bacterium]